MDIPVYLFTGFLDAGKTTFIQETLEDSRFNSGEKTLLLVCEEGEMEYEPQKFASNGITISVIENEEDLCESTLKRLQKEASAKRVIIEYNGMWQLSSLFSAMPKEWIIYQEMCFAEASTYIIYNQNMRSLVADKLNGCELLVLNRCDKTTDKEAVHKIVRSVSRKAEIAFEFRDKHVEYDDIKDPLPFNINDDIIKIEDNDYGIWYYDLMEELQKYRGKLVEFLGIAAKDSKMAKCEFAIGRHIMTCCVDDIQYAGVVAQSDMASTVKTGDWIRVVGKIKIENNDLYASKGPVLNVIKLEKAQPPKEKVVTLS